MSKYQIDPAILKEYETCFDFHLGVDRGNYVLCFPLTGSALSVSSINAMNTVNGHDKKTKVNKRRYYE